jgi:vacuolar-type H+-ATPase subunit I/STV1
VTKICDSFLGQRFDIPEGGVGDRITDVSNKIKETIDIMSRTREELRKYLFSINSIEGTDVSAILVQKWFILKEKTLYYTLNKLKFGDKLLVGLFWTPVSQTAKLDRKLQEI